MDKSALVCVILLTFYTVLVLGEQSYDMQEVSKIKAEMEKIEDKELAKFEQELKDAAAKRTSEPDYTPIIAFTAHTPNKGTINENDRIIFKTTTLNEGEAYDETTGIFTAPCEGLYRFEVQVCNTSGYYMTYAIVHNGLEVDLASEGYYENCGSSSAQIMMRKGGKVWVKSTKTGSMLVGRYHLPYFSGVLLHLF